MGFRSTFITEDTAILEYFPLWFKEKWDKQIMFGVGSVIASKWEAKTYGPYLSLETDIQKVLSENKHKGDEEEPYLVLVYLHECEGITKLKIYEDKIIYSEPTGWKKTDGVTHSYCYECSDV